MKLSSIRKTILIFNPGQLSLSLSLLLNQLRSFNKTNHILPRLNQPIMSFLSSSLLFLALVSVQNRWDPPPPLVHRIQCPGQTHQSPPYQIQILSHSSSSHHHHKHQGVSTSSHSPPHPPPQKYNS